MQILSPAPIRPAPGHPRSPTFRAPTRPPSPGPYLSRDTFVPADIQRRAAARPVPHLYLNGEAYIPLPEAFEHLEVVEPERAGGRSFIAQACLTLTAALLLAVFPGLMIYGAYTIAKKNS